MDLVTRYYEHMWNRWDYTLADELLAGDFVFRGSLGREVRGRDEFKGYMRSVQAAFSDFHNHIEEVIACGQHAAARLKYSGTHDGELLGLAPTFRRITYPGMAMFEVDGEQLVSGFVVGDRLDLLQQILGDSFWTVAPRSPIQGMLDEGPIRPATDRDVHWCAALMTRTEPWITLRRDREGALRQLGNRSKELYVAVTGDERVGFVLIDMRGAFAGYIQSLCVAPQFQNHGHGTALLNFAERRLLQDEPNVFLFVSSFNTGAQRFYARHGYAQVGSLTDFIIPGAWELILRKSAGPISTFKPASSPADPPTPGESCRA